MNNKMSREQSYKLPGPIPGTGCHHNMTLKSQDLLLEHAKAIGITAHRTILRRERAIRIPGKGTTISYSTAFEWINSYRN